jgi:hypothetical protein
MANDGGEHGMVHKSYFRLLMFNAVPVLTGYA